MITIYTITYNEKHIIEYFVKWYRSRFKDCTIVVFDNESTDGTQEIAESLGCEVVTYCTGGKLSDSTYLQIKNNIWKQSETDWVIVCDVDEFLDVNEFNLLECDKFNDRFIKSIGYNMCNVENITDITEIKHGIRATQYDKVLMFNKRYIEEINYGAGCHNCEPKGEIIYNNTISSPLYHMKFINEDLLVEKYKSYASRLSEENIINKWGYHYQESEETIRGSYKNHLLLAQKIR